MSEKVDVFYEATPNPASMKFVTTVQLTDISESFDGAETATHSPLAMKIFGFPWAKSVFLGPNFVTVTKEDWVDWDILASPLSDLIQEHLESGQAVVHKKSSNEQTTSDSESVKIIKKVLNEEIRPAVAMDGGDIVFERYEDKKVFVFMQGACAGCPSSTMTLKMGIEARLKEALPEIEEVVAI